MASASSGSARGLVLLYHNVASPRFDPFSLSLPAGAFEDQVRRLVAEWRPVPLRELVSRVRDGNVEDRSVAVTFDDGYAGVASAALPILEKYGVPATVFVTTAALSDPRGFWWDELQELILFAKALPQLLRLPLGPVFREFRLGRSTRRPVRDTFLHRRWPLGAPFAVTGRHALFRDLHRLLRPLEPESLARVMEAIRRQVGDGAPGDALANGSSAARTLSRADVGRLAAHPLVDVGSHTVHHPQLASLEESELGRELRESRSFLRETVGSAVPGFAYPYGNDASIGETPRAVEAAGYTFACANEPGPVTKDSDPFRLPRFIAPASAGARFARRLQRFHDAD